MKTLNLYSNITRSFVTFILVLSAISVSAQTRTIDGQTITQTVSWSGVVRVTGDVVVAETGILIIEQGTKVIFEAQSDSKKSGKDPTRCELLVRGVLLAKGTANNKITFTSASKSPHMGDWYGIQIASSRQGSEIEYAMVEYAYDGITIKKSNPQISNSHIRYNYNSGITVEIKANPKLIANVISENGYAGIVCRLDANPYLSENMIALNQIGIIVFGKSQPNLGSLKKGPDYNIGQNTIINNVEYDFHNHSSSPIMAENNSWGTTVDAEIGKQIYDGSDESKYGSVDFQPVLGSQRNAVNRILGNLYASSEAAAGNTSVNSQTNTVSRNQQSGQTQNELIAQNTNTESQRLAGTNNTQGFNTNNSEVEKTTDTKLPAVKQPSAITSPDPNDKQTLADEKTTQGTDAGKDLSEQNNTETPLLASNDKAVTEKTETNTVEEKFEEPAQPEINYDQIFFDGFLDEKKEIVKQVAPVVSEFRGQINLHGQVYVRVVIDRTGNVESAKAIRGINDYYDGISEEAAKKFVFKPGKINGRLVKFQTMLLFKF